MGSRYQREYEGGSPNLAPGCKSLGQYETEWPTVKGETLESPKKQHKQRGGQANHGLKVEPGQDLNELHRPHPRSKTWSGEHKS